MRATDGPDLEEPLKIQIRFRRGMSMELKSSGLILASFSRDRTASLACGKKTEKVEKPVS